MNEITDFEKILLDCFDSCTLEELSQITDDLKLSSPDCPNARAIKRQTRQKLEAEYQKRNVLPTLIRGKLFSRDSERRVALTAVAAVIALLCAGSVFAYGVFHFGIFSSAWGGDAGTEIGTYLSATGEVCEYPAFERAAFDQEKAEAVLGKYVVSCGKSYTCAGNTVTVLEYMCDDLGMGYVSLLIENPNGISGLIHGSNGTVYFDGSSGFIEPQVLSGYGGMADQRLVSNNGMSSETQAYISIAFAGLSNVTDSDGLNLMYYEDDGNGGTRESVLELPSFKKIPSLGFSDSERLYAVEVSPLGISVGKTHEPDGGDISDMRINYTEDTYVIHGDGMANVVFGVCNSRKFRTDTVFNRMVTPDEITSVMLNGVVLAPSETLPEAGRQIDYADGDFSFSYGGSQVFVLAANSINAASDDEWSQFCVAEGAEWTRKDMLDCYHESPSVNDLSAAEAIRLAYEKFSGSFDLNSDTVFAEFARYSEDCGVWTLRFLGCANVTIETPSMSSVSIDYTAKLVKNNIAESSEVESTTEKYNRFIFADVDKEAAGPLAQKLFNDAGYVISIDSFEYCVSDYDNNPNNRYHHRVLNTASGQDDMLDIYFPYIRVSAAISDTQIITAAFVPTIDGGLEPIELSVETQ